LSAANITEIAIAANERVVLVVLDRIFDDAEELREF
jgi:hypothetical protein